MPRKKLIYTDQFPYHIQARSNNKEWFYIPKDATWKVFLTQLKHVVRKFNFKIHAFVLMDNHYHLLASTSYEFDLGVVMCELQKSVSRNINNFSGRINHVFGGPYKASLVTKENYYYHVYKYIYRNPIEANIVDDIEKYKYSSLNSLSVINTVKPTNGIDALIPYDEQTLWINKPIEKDLHNSIKCGLKRSKFKYAISRKY